MKYLLAIDDTDQENWPGTGHLLEKIRNNIQKNKWGLTTKITRHQLFVHPSIPYTSHNSVMCFSGEVSKELIRKIRELTIDFIKKESAPRSDPGLCMVFPEELNFPEKLINFGKKAKKEKISKEDAYSLANQLSIHLSEHGGTGDGIIGALAGTGLRLSGNDGRFRGCHFIAESIIKYQVSDLCRKMEIDRVCTENGRVLSDEDWIFLEGKIKTIFKNNQSVLLVKKYQEGNQAFWKNLTHSEIKHY